MGSVQLGLHFLGYPQPGFLFVIDTLIPCFTYHETDTGEEKTELSEVAEAGP